MEGLLVRFLRHFSNVVQRPIDNTKYRAFELHVLNLMRGGPGAHGHAVNSSGLRGDLLALNGVSRFRVDVTGSLL